MNYLKNYKILLLLPLVATAYCAYKILHFSFGKIITANLNVHLFMNLPAFYYVATLFLIVLFLSSNFILCSCKELCIDLYGIRNYMFLIPIIFIHIVCCLFIYAITILHCHNLLGFDGRFAWIIFKYMLLGYFLPGIAVILIGVNIGRLSNLKHMIAVSFVILALSSPMFVSNCEMTAMPLYMQRVLDNLNLLGSRFNGDSYTIDTTYTYKWLKMLGIIAISLVPFVITFGKRFKKFTIAALLFIFTICEVYFYMPNPIACERYAFCNRSLYYVLEEKKMPSVFDDESPFVIKSYDMDIKFTNYMSVKCNLELEDLSQDTYTFTLYHTLKVKKVMCDGKNVDFERKLDYITVKNLTSPKIYIEYWGTVDDFIVSDINIMLSEYYAYYPIAGKRELRSGYVLNDYKADFSIKTNIKDKFYTNLKADEDGIYKGHVYGASFLKALTVEYDIDGIKIVVPRYPFAKEAITEEKIRNTVANLKKLYGDEFDMVWLEYYSNASKSSIYCEDGYIEYNALIIDDAKLELYKEELNNAESNEFNEGL